MLIRPVILVWPWRIVLALFSVSSEGSVLHSGPSISIGARFDDRTRCTQVFRGRIPHTQGRYREPKNRLSIKNARAVARSWLTVEQILCKNGVHAWHCKVHCVRVTCQVIQHYFFIAPKCQSILTTLTHLVAMIDNRFVLGWLASLFISQ